MPTRILAYSCEHAPFTPAAHQEWLLREIADFKPQIIVHLGDRFESAAASVHPDEHQHTLEDEYEAAAKFSAQVRKQAPKARYVWTLGNHDDNLQKQDPRRVPKSMRSLLHWNKSAWGEEFRQWEQLPYVNDDRCCFTVGQVVFYHGFAHSDNSDEGEALEMAMWLGGHSHRLFIRGHTHRPQQVTQAERTKKRPLPWWYANVGTVGPLKPEYMKRQSTLRWGVACAKVECDPKARMGKAWDCEIAMR
jgi:3',5'-cyclic AMP phosphodiesterase CpdA